MSDNNLIGKNIRALRKAYGYSQENLAKAIRTSRTNIIHYEKDGYSDFNIISLIAKHFEVSIQELMYSDLSGYDLHLSIDNLNNAVNAIHLLFPIIESEKALSNSIFSEAYTIQKELYSIISRFDFSNLKKDIINKDSGNEVNIDYYLHLIELYKKLPDCLNNLAEAFKDDEIKIESAVNYISVYHILSSQKLALSAFFDKTAILSLMVKFVSTTEKAIENISSFSEKDLKYRLSQFFPSFEDTSNSKRQNDLLNVMMSTIKKQKEYSDLAEYYVALEFVDNIVDNGFDRATNKRNGYEMLKRISKLGNIYAKRYIKLNPDPIE